MKTLLPLLATLSAIICRVDSYPFHFLALMAMAGLGLAIGLVWQSERRPHPATSWPVETIRSLPIAVPTATRKRFPNHWSSHVED